MVKSALLFASRRLPRERLVCEDVRTIFTASAHFWHPTLGHLCVLVAVEQPVFGTGRRTQSGTEEHSSRRLAGSTARPVAADMRIIFIASAHFLALRLAKLRNPSPGRPPQLSGTGRRTQSGTDTYSTHCLAARPARSVCGVMRTIFTASAHFLHPTLGHLCILGVGGAKFIACVSICSFV